MKTKKEDYLKVYRLTLHYKPLGGTTITETYRNLNKIGAANMVSEFQSRQDVKLIKYNIALQ